MEKRNSKWNVTSFGNRLSWKSIPSILPQSEMAGRAGIDKIVVTDLDGLWTFIPE